MWLITCRVTTVGAAPTTDLSAVQGSYPLCADSHRHLRACGPRMPPLPYGWRIELFHSSRRTPLCVFGGLIPSQLLLAKLHTCDDADVLRLSPPFGLRNATHRLPFTCRLLNGVSRQRPCLHTSATSRSAPSPLPTRLGCLALPLAVWIAVWLVVRPAPPAALRRLMFPVSGHLNRRLFHDTLLSQNDHGLWGP